MSPRERRTVGTRLQTPIPEKKECRKKKCREELRGLCLRAEAPRADFYPHGIAADMDDLAVQVRPEDTVRLVRFALPTTRVLVTDVAAERRALAADCANRR